jgi:ketosteroid isomerase-like protein
MKPSPIRLFLLGLLLLTPSLARAQTVSELDAFWAEVSRTVEAGDFAGYAALYHPDAVLVALGSWTSYPIARALAGWERGFVDTAEGKARAGVSFRLTQRLHDDTTAHETGIFRYTYAPDGGEEVEALVHFEGLLVRKDGGWLLVMEYQKQAATAAEWEAAG